MTPRSEEAIRRAKTKYYMSHKDEVVAKAKARGKTQKDKETNKIWRASHKAQLNSAARRDYAAHPERMREKNLKKWYGITLADYNRMFEEQNGCCLICGVHQSEVKKTFNVDHDHETGEVRGLLCNMCNSGLGLFRDDPTLVQRALDYLKRVLP
jgi:hypothetical protein